MLTLMATNTKKMRLRHLRHQSRDARHHRDFEPVCHAESDFRRTHAAWHWPRRQFTACAGQKAGYVAQLEESIEDFRDLTSGKEIDYEGGKRD